MCEIVLFLLVSLLIECLYFFQMIYFLYSSKSPGSQSKALQMASRVLKRMAFALPVFKIERLESVKSTFSESSLRDIFLLAIITSRLTTIGIIIWLIRYRTGFRCLF